MVSREGAWRTEGFPYALDNGAWTDFRTGQPFDGPKFTRLIERLGRDADWIVTPDIVSGGHASLDLSISWLSRVLDITKLALVPVQDGLEPKDLVDIVGPNVGIFLGGSTEWKLANARKFGIFCVEHDLYYHIGRVNSKKRIGLAVAVGATSIDGSSVSRYAATITKLDRARRRFDLCGLRD